MLDAIKEKHAAISSRFGSGDGAKLQVQDARLAELTLLYGAWQGITVLPVHDSFIVRADKQGEFEQVMRDAFKAAFGQDVGVKAKRAA